MKKMSKKAKQRQKQRNRKGKKERTKGLKTVIVERNGRLYEESEGFSDLANADEIRDQLDQYIQQFREKQK